MSRPSDRAIAEAFWELDAMPPLGVSPVSRPGAVGWILDRARELDASGDAGAVAWLVTLTLRSGATSRHVTEYEPLDDALPPDAKIEPLYTHPPVESAPGFVLVPVEPTRAMLDAGASEYDSTLEIYRAMLAAAPAAAQENAP